MVGLAAQEDLSEGAGTPDDESWETVKFVMIAVAIALLLRMFIFQPYNIPSGSMRPSLLVGDFLYVSKTSYGYSRASLVWPLTKLPFHGRLFGEVPERGDVVVFKNKKDRNKDYIKRLIGMPGDEITIRGGTVYINDAPVPRDYLGTAPGICDDVNQTQVPVYRETLSNGINYIVQECHGDEGMLDWRGPYTVPTGHYFMMGDNRDQSRDSRVEASVGTIPFEDFVGEAERVVISFDGRASKIWQVWNWPRAVRGSRLFKSIE